MNVITAQRPADISSPAAADVPQPPSGSRRGRGGLFRKYLLLFIGLVSAALLINASIEAAFNYRENLTILERLQQEKADAAAQQIAQFIDEIERQLGWTTQGQWAAGSVEQRRFDYVRLLRQVPAITELRQLDAAGKEQLKVSRLAMDVVASGVDFSHDILVIDALSRKIAFSSVYFRNESEPYLTIAIAGSGRNPGVTMADVNLKLIWDVIRGLKVGRGGYAYVVDQQGRLIAHPDISLVLRNTSFVTLPQVALGLRETGGAAPAPFPVGPRANNHGERVLSAHATLPALGWLVFVELPRAEALEPLYQSGMRTAVVLLVGLGLAALVALFVVRRMVGPIRLLEAGAARIGAGDLDSRIDVRTGDELESLAGQFNTMAAQLQQSYSGLERKVAERTQELQEALEQQTATAEVLGVINASPGNLTPVFDAMLEKAMRLCEAAFGSLYTFDGQRFRSEAQRGVPAAYAAFRERHPPELVGGAGLEQAVRTRRAVQITDMMAERPYLDGNPNIRAMVELGGMRTGVVVPLCKDEAVLGVISIYRQEVRAFTQKQITLLENFAAQAVIAMESARLLHELRARTDELAQSQAELRVTFENMADGVAMFDDTQRLVAWNRKFQDVLDVPDAIIARRPTFPEYVRYLAERGEYGAEADPKEQVRRLTEQAGQYRVYERTRPDGRVIEIRHNPVAGGGFVLIYADITERKRNEAEIRAARDAAEEASRTIEAAYRDLKVAQANLIQAEKMASLGQLTAGIAHEIKNPLNFVNNFAALSVDLLAELRETAAPGFATLTANQRAEIDDVSAMLTSNLQKITEHGKRADGIVKAMLEHSRGSSGERRMVDLNAVIEEALNLAYHGARAQDQSFNITLERDFAEGIAPIEVNPQDMTRVFLNIFGNGFYAANKRAHNGGDAGFMPTLKVTTRDAGEAVEIRVRDNGTGIPADIRDKVFQPFFTTKPTGEGTGLGLSITYDIVTQQHGGSIAVDSKVGEYSEFTIRLPRTIAFDPGARQHPSDLLH